MMATNAAVATDLSGDLPSLRSTGKTSSTPIIGWLLRKLSDEHSDVLIYFAVAILLTAVVGTVIWGLPFLLGMALIMAPLNLILIVIMTAG